MFTAPWLSCDKNRKATCAAVIALVLCFLVPGSATYAQTFCEQGLPDFCKGIKTRSQPVPTAKDLYIYTFNKPVFFVESVDHNPGEKVGGQRAGSLLSAGGIRPVRSFVCPGKSVYKHTQAPQFQGAMIKIELYSCTTSLEIGRTLLFNMCWPPYLNFPRSCATDSGSLINTTKFVPNKNQTYHVVANIGIASLYCRMEEMNNDRLCDKDSMEKRIEEIQQELDELKLKSNH